MISYWTSTFNGSLLGFPSVTVWFYLTGWLAQMGRYVWMISMRIWLNKEDQEVQVHTLIYSMGDTTDDIL